MPWSNFWDHNVFLVMAPALEQLLSSPYARGAVSGIGVITTIAGILELAAAFSTRRTPAPDRPETGR